MSKPKAIVKICRNVKRGKRFVAYIYRDGARVLIGGNLPGGLTGDPASDYEALLVGHHGVGRLLRSVVISLDCPTTPAMVNLHADGLARCAIEFCAKYAPGAPFVFAVHKNGGKLHCHVLPQNSNGEKCLEWSPDVLQEMQGFGWTARFESGRGKGVTQVEGKTVYPAKGTAAAALAGSAAEALKNLLANGDLTVARVRKDGSPLSLVFEGKRLRVQTVNAIDPGFSARLTEAMKDDDGGDYLLGIVEQKRAAKQQVKRH